MAGNIIYQVLSVSFTVSIIILILLLLLPVVKRRYCVKWRYFIWFALAIRLVFPVNILPQPVISIKVPKILTSQINETNNKSLIGDQNQLMKQQLPATANNKSDYESNSPQKPEEATVYAPNNKENQIGTADNILNTLPIIGVSIWIAGAAIFFSFHLFCYYTYRKKLLNHSRKPNDDIQHTLNELKEELKITGDIIIKSCDKVEAPMQFGFLKPYIFIPEESYSQLQATMIIKHELIHYKRKDIWYKLVMLIANSVHWFNPLVYILVRQANEDLEVFCDEEVVKNQDLDYCYDYGKVILSVIVMGRKKGYLLSYLQGSKNTMKERLAQIMNVTDKKRGKFSLCAIMLFILMASSMAGCTALESKSSSDPVKTDILPNEEVPSLSTATKQQKDDHILSPEEIVVADFMNYSPETYRPAMLYASDETVMFYDFRGLFVMSLGQNRITQVIDLQKYNLNYFDNDKTQTQIKVSKDGSRLILYNMEESNIVGDIYTGTIKNSSEVGTKIQGITLEKRTEIPVIEEIYEEYGDVFESLSESEWLKSKSLLYSKNYCKDGTSLYYLRNSIDQKKADSTNRMLNIVQYNNKDKSEKLYPIWSQNEIGGPEKFLPAYEHKTSDPIEKLIYEAELLEGKKNWQLSGNKVMIPSPVEYGRVEIDNGLKVFIRSMYQVYLPYGDTLLTVGGSATAKAYLLEKDKEGSYQIKEVITAQDGGLYFSSIKEFTGEHEDIANALISSDLVKENQTLADHIRDYVLENKLPYIYIISPMGGIRLLFDRIFVVFKAFLC